MTEASCGRAIVTMSTNENIREPRAYAIATKLSDCNNEAKATVPSTNKNGMQLSPQQLSAQELSALEDLSTCDKIKELSYDEAKDYCRRLGLALTGKTGDLHTGKTGDLHTRLDHQIQLLTTQLMSMEEDGEPPAKGSDTSVEEDGKPPAKRLKNLDGLINYYTCPITKTLPVEPVCGSDGRIYEKDPLEKWIVQSGDSPVTREEM